jgi:hypothetical protein
LLTLVPAAFAPVTAEDGALRVGIVRGAAPRETSPDAIDFGPDDRVISGFASNFSRQPAEQKK